MEKWFNEQSKLIRIILLFIPVVNWVIEVLVRWSHALRKGNLIKLIIAIFVTFGGLIIGWLDAIWILLFDHLFLCDK